MRARNLPSRLWARILTSWPLSGTSSSGRDVIFPYISFFYAAHWPQGLPDKEKVEYFSDENFDDDQLEIKQHGKWLLTALTKARECQGCRSHYAILGDLLSRDPRAFGIEMIPSAPVETPGIQFVLKGTHCFSFGSVSNTYKFFISSEKSCFLSNLNYPLETDKPDDPAEIVEIVDERGYSHLICGPFLVPRRYFFGLTTIQEPFDPQRDLGWDLRWLKITVYVCLRIKTSWSNNNFLPSPIPH